MMALTNGGSRSEGDDCVPVLPAVKNEMSEQLEDFFILRFKCRPDFLVRVPGRVNIIGEHIDYCGFPVLPMALDQNILLAVKINPRCSIEISNINDKYEDFSTSMNDISIVLNGSGGPAWYNYVLCGVRGALEALPEGNEIKGVTIAVSGNIPPASGLSSSSALVSAAALAILHAHGVELSKRALASICAQCERYIGTEGGGMDQAIAFLAVQGCAQYIKWDPVRASPVSLPSNATFVVAHSLVEANKAATGDFNQRVTECRLAVKVLGIQNGVYSRLQKFTFSELQRVLHKSTEEMVDLVNLQLKTTPYSHEDLCIILQISNDEFHEKHLPPNVKHIAAFKLNQRALHVFQEAQRVDTFRDACAILVSNEKDNGDCDARPKMPQVTNGRRLQNNASAKQDISDVDILGRLMRESHASLQHLYECSHPNLDRLVELSDEFGVSARLTGAGWGGCVVALCPLDRAADYVDMLKERFYGQNPFAINERDVSSLVFVTSPKQGAEIFLNSC